MKKEFRSRGIRLMKNIDYLHYNIPNLKVYYNADINLLDNVKLQNYVNKSMLKYFEYSVLETGEIDNFNFHTDVGNIPDDIYKNLSEAQLNHIKKIPLVFDKNFLNYTVGYRVRGEKIVIYNYYFYPTVKKGDRIGLKGVTDKDKIQKYMNNFIKFLNITDSDVKDEIKAFFSLTYKFKGLIITFNENDLVEYKIYGRIETEKIYKFIEDKILVDTNVYRKYGEVTLVGQRIRNKQVVGYNIYYLS